MEKGTSQMQSKGKSFDKSNSESQRLFDDEHMVINDIGEVSINQNLAIVPYVSVFAGVYTHVKLHIGCQKTILDGNFGRSRVSQGSR